MELNNEFLETFQKEAYETAVSKGWHESDELDANGHPTARQKLAWLALVTDELDEAVIERCNGRFDTYYDLKGKPCGFHTEYADALIRIGDMCGACGWKLNTKRDGRSLEFKRNEFTESIRCGDLKTQNEVVSQLFLDNSFRMETITDVFSRRRSVKRIGCQDGLQQNQVA